MKKFAPNYTKWSFQKQYVKPKNNPKKGLKKVAL